MLKMRIVLDDLAKPFRSPMRQIKSSLQDSLRKQIDSWLQDGVTAPEVSLSGSPLVPVTKKKGIT